MVSVLVFQEGYRGFESRSGRDSFQTISTPSSYSAYLGLSIKWTGWCLVIDSGTKCALAIHESKAVQIHVHNNRRFLYVPQVPGSVKSPHIICFNGLICAQARYILKLATKFNEMWHSINCRFLFTVAIWAAAN